MTTAIVIAPQSHSELVDLAKNAASSGFFGCKNQQEALMFLVTGRDLGLSYSQALRAFDNIKGKLALKADAMVAVCLAHPDVCERFECVEATNERATWVAKRRGGVERRMTFTLDDAKAAGLLSSDMYRKWPQRMLSHRCKSLLARDTFPDLLLGLYSDEEASTFDARPAPQPVELHATPTEPAPTTTTLVSDEEDGFLAALRDVTDPDALGVIAGQIKSSKTLSEDAKARLRREYDVTRKAIERGAELDRMADQAAGAAQ